MTTTWTTDELLETVEDLVRQFAYPTTKDGVPVLITGGLSALEDAFAVLGWDDPHRDSDALREIDDGEHHQDHQE